MGMSHFSDIEPTFIPGGGGNAAYGRVGDGRWKF